MRLTTTILVAINVIIFFLMYKENQAALSNPSSELLLRAGADYGPLVADGQSWRILTCAFVHIGVVHLALNMLALSSIGSVVELQVGALKYLAIYFSAMIAASLLSLYIHPYTISAGASGAIFGLLGCQLLMLLGLWRHLPKKQLISALLSDVIMIGLYFTFGSFFPQIDNFAHLGGLIGGLASGLVLMPLSSKSKTPSLFNIAGLVALTAMLSQANGIVLHRVKQATEVMTTDQVAYIQNFLKKNNLPFWYPVKFSSPSEALGAASLRCTDYKTAINLSNKAVGLDPDNAHVYYNRALVQNNFSHAEEALADINKGLSLIPADYTFTLLKARIELSLKHFDAAMKEIQAALKTELKEHAEAKDIAGCCCLARQQFRAAINWFDQAIADDPAAGASYYHRAMTYQRSSAKLKAQQDFDRAQERNYVPSNWDQELTADKHKNP
jgi:membrane associated rhomboid family serine protease